MTLDICQIQIRRGLAATWSAVNPTLAAGEWGLETDTGRLKIGDGLTPWLLLSTAPSAIGPVGPGAAGALADPALYPSLNFATDDTSQRAAFGFWTSGPGIGPTEGAYFQFLCSTGTVSTPGSLSPGCTLGRVEFFGFNAADGKYHQGAGLTVFMYGAATPSGDWPSAWLLYWTSDGGSSIDSQVTFASQANFAYMVLSGPTFSGGVGVDNNLRVFACDSSGTNAAPFKCLTLGVGGDPDPSAIADVQGTSQGFLVPRMSTADMLATLLPANGLLVFNTDVGNFRVFRSGSWQAIDQPAAPVFSGCRAWHSVPVIVPNNTFFFLEFDNETFDTNSYHSSTVQPWLFTVPFTGFYSCGAAIAWAANFTGARELRIMYAPAGGGGPFVAAATSQQAVVDSLTFTSQSISTVLFLPAGSLVFFQAWQHSGANLTLVAEKNNIADPPANSFQPQGWIHFLGS